MNATSPVFRDHPLRESLTHEVHARPFERLTAPERASHLAVLSGEGGAEEDRHHVVRLCARYNVAPPEAGATHFSADLGPVRLKWERHSEFSTYTFFRRGAFDDPFADPVIALVPADWLAALPGTVLVAIHAALEPQEAAEHGPEELSRLFNHHDLVGSRVSGGAAEAWCDFRIHGDGFERILIRDRGLRRERQAGRLLQRLLEIETYRVFALLALPLAREGAGRIAAVDRALTEVVGRLAEVEGVTQEKALLDRLSALSGDIERLTAQTSYRFSAARAYYALVQARLAELREERIAGVQTYGEFTARRLSPAMRFCEATSERQEHLALRLARAGELLRTRVDVALEAQNSALLNSMNRRAQLQLRLQETVEGLSVVAVSYYLLALVGHAVSALAALGLHVDHDRAMAFAFPVVLVLVTLGIRRLRKVAVGKHED